MVIIGGAAYFLYAGFLTPREFGMYMGVLAISKLANMVLDSGFKIAIIKSKKNLSIDVERSIFLMSICLSGLIFLSLSLVLTIIYSFDWLNKDFIYLLFFYISAYLVTYPFLVLPLANLERQLRFTSIVYVETTTMLIELLLPAFLWLFIYKGFSVFIWGAWIGRGLRTLLMFWVYEEKSWLKKGQSIKWKLTFILLKEGLGFQLGNLISMLRDNLHILIIGPIFGAAWVGYYSWSLQICAVTFQIFAQGASRVGLAVISVEQNRNDQWIKSLEQLKITVIMATPVLFFLPTIAYLFDENYYHGKWSIALIILPYLCVRIFPSIATSALTPYFINSEGANRFAYAMFWWTMLEVFFCILSINIFGPLGLAISYSLAVWIGVFVIIGKNKKSTRLREILKIMFARPSLLCAIIFFIVLKILGNEYFQSAFAVMAYIIFAISVSILSEKSIRFFLKELKTQS